MYTRFLGGNIVHKALMWFIDYEVIAKEYTLPF